MLIRYILSYIIALLLVYFYNDEITNLFSGNQALIKFVELTLPLTIPSLLYFFKVNKDRQECMEKENQKVEDYKNNEKDKLEKSLPFFYVRDGIIFAKSPQKLPILNVKFQLGSMENDFNVFGEVNTLGSIHSEHNLSIGGLVDGDQIDIDKLLAKNKISKHIRWFVVSATTVTNNTIYFVYLTYLKIGWHFYKKEDFGKSKIVKYISDDIYCELAELLAMHISDRRNEFSYKGIILNQAAAYLERYNLQEAFSQLIILVREVKEFQKYEKLYILHKSYLMLYQLEDSNEIKSNYFINNLVGDCEFTTKYKGVLENCSQRFSIKEYLYDIIKLIKADEKVYLDLWLRNVEVYIRNHSIVFSEEALAVGLKEIIPHLVGSSIDMT